MKLFVSLASILLTGGLSLLTVFLWKKAKKINEFIHYIGGRKMIVVTVIIGILVGLATGWAFLALAARQSRALLVTTAVFGGLGAAAANQLLTWGLTIWSISILPVLAGSIVLPLIAIYAFYLGKRRFHKLRENN